MKWSFKIVRLWGIDVYVHGTFILWLLVLAFKEGLLRGDLKAALAGVTYFLTLFVCVVLHEYGHALTARRFGIRTRDITLLPIGGVARLERIPTNPRQELLVAIAGPLVNVAIAAVLALFLVLSGQSMAPEQFAEPTTLHALLLVNLGLVLFNLLPAFPMDGGRVLRALLAMKMDHGRATRIAATLGRGMALVLGVVGVTLGPPMLIFIAIFVWIGAGSEATASGTEELLNRITVEKAMLTEFHCIAPDDRLSRVIELILAGTQHDFPVVSGGEAVGHLARGRLFQVLAAEGDEAEVSRAMEQPALVVQKDEPIEEAMLRLHETGAPLAVVLDGTTIAGLLTPENVAEFIIIRQALARRRQVPPVIRPGT